MSQPTRHHWRDRVNGTFEICGSFFLSLHIIKILHDKSVAGLDWRACVFFTVWSYWNLYYYPSLHQRLSFWGSLFMATLNTIWLALIIYYGELS